MATHRCYTRKQSLPGTGFFTFTGLPQSGKTWSLQKFWISKVKVGSGRNFTETKSFGPCMYHSLQILIYRQEVSHSPTQHSSEGTGTVRRHLSEVVLDFNICIRSLNPPAVPAGLPTVCHRFSQDGTWDHRPLKEWRPVTQTFKGPDLWLAFYFMLGQGGALPASPSTLFHGKSLVTSWKSTILFILL